MGNSGLKQHIENSGKTGVFQMKDAGLAEVGLIHTINIFKNSK